MAEYPGHRAEEEFRQFPSCRRLGSIQTAPGRTFAGPVYGTQRKAGNRCLPWARSWCDVGKALSQDGVPGMHQGGTGKGVHGGDDAAHFLMKFGLCSSLNLVQSKGPIS